MREMTAERYHAVVRLLDHGECRLGRWSDDHQIWVSIVDPMLVLQPIAYAEMPVAPPE